MKYVIVLLVSLVLIFNSCANDSKTEKYQNSRSNMENVKDKVREIKIGGVLIGSIARLFTIKDKLIITDYKTTDKLIHIFNKDDFKYISSCAPLGRGPSEITGIGHIAVDNNKFYVSDHGKQKIFSYDLDSVLLDPEYMPKVKTEMNKDQFPSTYYLINDSVGIGRIIAPTGNSGFNEIIAKWNMFTGEIKPMKYKHPDIEKRRVVFAVSKKNKIYVECNSYQDLMTICDFEGNLICNIYGPNWSKESKHIHYFGNVVFCGDKIIASYAGSGNSDEDYYPTKLIVFDINGNYIKTLEIGYKISDLCYDGDNERIIMNFNDVIQFGYLDLKDLYKKSGN